MDGSFSFNIHEYFKIQSNAHREITSKISAKEKEIEVECQSMTEKSEKERREMKTKMMEESSDICELKEKLKQMEGVQYDADVLRDGVLCVSNMYGLIFFSMKRDLFVVPSATIQTRADMPPSRSFGSNITQVSLSPSELYVSVCAGNTVEIFAAKRLKEQVLFEILFCLFSISPLHFRLYNSQVLHQFFGVSQFLISGQSMISIFVADGISM